MGDGPESCAGAGNEHTTMSQINDEGTVKGTKKKDTFFSVAAAAAAATGGVVGAATSKASDAVRDALNTRQQKEIVHKDQEAEEILPSSSGNHQNEVKKAYRTVTAPVVQAEQYVIRGAKQVAKQGKKVKDMFPSPSVEFQDKVPTTFSAMSPGRTRDAISQLTQDDENDNDTVPLGHHSYSQAVLPPDKTLQSMEIIMRKRLNGVSISEFYQVCWSEEEGRNNSDASTTAFYGPWLVEDGKLDVKVGDWEVAPQTEGGGEEFIIGDWDKEKYQQKRKVTYRYKRDPKTMGYSLGKPEVFVTQTQYYRSEGGGHESDNGNGGGSEDRSILSMTMEMDGEVFADSFKVQIRGVATRVGQRDLAIDFGVFVCFRKQVLIAGQIRDITTKETTKSMLDLFRSMKVAIGAVETDSGMPEEKGMQDVSKQGSCDLLVKEPSNFLSHCFPIFHRTREYKDDIDRVTHEIQGRLNQVLALPARRISANKSKGEGEEQQRDYEHVRVEFKTIQEALNSILTRFMELDSYNAPKKDDAGVPSTQAFSTKSSALMLFDPVRSIFQKQYSVATRLGKKLYRANKEPTRNQLSSGEAADFQGCGDQILKHMNVTISQVFDGSVKDFYRLIGVNESNFDYGSWLASTGRVDVNIGDWIFSKKGDSFIEEWSKESFQQKRTVSCRYEVNSNSISELTAYFHPIVSITQSQFCRFEENVDKCVFAITTKLDGAWFSDAFNLQTRWVVTLAESSKIQVKVGIFVLMMKKTMLSRKLTTEAMRSATKIQLNLLEKIKATLGVPLSNPLPVEKKVSEMDDVQSPQSPLEECIPMTSTCCMPRMHDGAHPGSMIALDEDLSKHAVLMKRKLRAVQVILDDRNPSESTENMNFCLSQLHIVCEALDNVIAWHGSQDEGLSRLAHHVVFGVS